MSELILAVVLVGLLVVAALVIERTGKRRRAEETRRELERFWRRATGLPPRGFSGLSDPNEERRQR